MQRSKDSTPKGFTPRNQVPTGTQRRNQKNNAEEEGPGTSPPKEFTASNTETPLLEIGSNEDEVSSVNIVAGVEAESDGIGLEVASTSQLLFDDKVSPFEENEGIPQVDKHIVESEDAEGIPQSEVSNNAGRLSYVDMLLKNNEHRWNKNIKLDDLQEKAIVSGDPDAYGRVIKGKEIYTRSIEDKLWQNIEKEEFVEDMGIFEARKNVSSETHSRIYGIGTNSKTAEQVGSFKTVDDFYKRPSVKPEVVNDGYNSIREDKQNVDDFLKLKLESEEILRKEAIVKIASDNFRKGNKLFYYPEVVKPDQDIEIFFNRSFSTLKNEPNVIVMGAFNDWKWKSFTIRLSKSNLNGDWWSCQVHVPKEAYKIDFVFYNGEDVYDNNDEQDFCITVEGGIDVFDFENFLLEDKRKEQEEVARQKAERERQAEEQRRIEAEIVASEADRAQAKDEVAKRRKMLQELMKDVVTSVVNVWYIEPSGFGANDMVRLYYNKSSGPLSHANDIWIHGGHNSWEDGLSIVSKLIKSEKKGADWWYADGEYVYELSLIFSTRQCLQFVLISDLRKYVDVCKIWCTFRMLLRNQVHKN